MRECWQWGGARPLWLQAIGLGMLASSIAYALMPPVPSLSVPIRWTPLAAFELDPVYVFVLPGWLLAESAWACATSASLHYEKIMFVGNAGCLRGIGGAAAQAAKTTPNHRLAFAHARLRRRGSNRGLNQR